MVMAKELEIVYVEKPEWNVIGQAINDYNEHQAGDDKAHNICFVLRENKEEIVGGIIGTTYWDWFNISLMWVKEALRGQGYGHRLLTLAEDAARLRGARFALLDTTRL
jgi:GNAT superfamily N-acetyltransferase